MIIIDLAFLVIIIPWQMIPLARSRGRSVIGWTLGAIGAYIATSIAVSFAYAMIQSFGAFHLGWSVETMLIGIRIARIFGIICSIVAFNLLRQRLAAKTPPPNQSL